MPAPSPRRSVFDRLAGRRPEAGPGLLDPQTPSAPAVVVTGGADGIGFALALRFARAGHAVVIVGRRQEALDAAAQTIAAATGRLPLVVALDVTLPDAPGRIEAALTAHGLVLDVLVSNAGIGLSGAFAEQSPADIDHLIALNIAALTRLMRAALPGMLARGRGGVLNIASLGGFTPGPWQAAYYASKAYVIALTEAVAAETRGRGVRVCALAPGPVATRFHARMGAETALYRRLVPAMSADRVANAGYWGYRLGRTVIVPGLLPSLAAVALRVVPHIITTPLVAVLLRPRHRGEGHEHRTAR